MTLKVVRERDVVKAAGPPVPTAWEIACPSCERLVAYEPDEDDAGQWTVFENWPVCEECDVVIEPPTVAVRTVEDGPFWQSEFRG